MKRKRSEVWRRGAGAGVAILIIFALILLVIIRSIWFAKADAHYDNVISAYISRTEDYEDGDEDGLRKQLLEDGIFVKMFRWDKKSFVKDKQLYDEMLKAYKRQQREKEKGTGSVIQDLINL